MKGYTIEQVREMLSNQVLEVEFVKVDGSTRHMMASTNSMYIPESDTDTFEDSNRPRSPDVLSVIDTEIGEWRSIRFDRISFLRTTGAPVLEYDEAQ